MKICFLIFTEGQIHGSCDSSEVCVDRNSECYNATCQCVDGFSDQEHSCWEGISHQFFTDQPTSTPLIFSSQG